MNWVIGVKQHEKFMFFYRSQNWDIALKFAVDLRDEFNGTLSKYYDMMRERIIELKSSDLPSDWDGIYRATSK